MNSPITPKIIVTKAVVSIIVLLLFSTLAAADHITNLHVCDTPTANVKELVTVCYKEGSVDKTLTLDSIQRLNANNQKPVTIHDPSNFHNLTFLYEAPPEGEPKTVRVLLTKNITEQRSFPLGSFSMNMVSGFRLLLVLDGQHYALSHLPEQPLFDTTHLRLLHIPTKQQFTPVNHPGTSWYLFNTFGDTGKKIALGIFGDQFLISPLDPGEAPAAYVTPWNLEERWEVSFTKAQPAEITQPAGVGTLTICQEDVDTDPIQVQVCRNNQQFQTLARDRLTTITIGSKEYAFLYEFTGNGKRVSIFNLVTPSSAVTSLGYSNLITSLLEGRRVALKFQNTLYLLSHSSASLFSLRNIQLTAYQTTATGTTTIPNSGSEDSVEFPTISGGKMFLRRLYGTPPPPFELTALRQEELTPINLVKQLHTSFSSLGKITVTTPSFGTIQKADDDASFYQPTFKIALETGQITPLLLNYRQPRVVAEDGHQALFYYYEASITGATPVKIGSLYLLYDLTTEDKSRTFNDEFITIFTSGKEVALQFGESYYLLGYQGASGTSNQMQFYDPSKLRLHTLDSSQSFPVNVEQGVASFTVTEEKILIAVDIEAQLIHFRGKTGAELLTESTLEKYFAELASFNSVKIGASTLRLCFKEAYAPLPAAKVCDDKTTPPKVPDTLVDLAVIINVEGTNYLLEMNGEIGEAKKVLIRKMVRLNSTKPFAQENWFTFMNEVLADKGPVFNISNVTRTGVPLYYFLQAQNALLETVALQRYFPPPPAQELEEIQALQQKTPITANGSIVTYDRVVFFNQIETTDENNPVRLEIFTRPYSYLPDNGDPLVYLSKGGDSIPFITTLTGDLFKLSIPATTDITPQGLVKLKLEMVGKPAFLERYFAQGDVKQLTLNGVPVTITIDQVVTTAPRSATISIKRS